MMAISAQKIINVAIADGVYFDPKLKIDGIKLIFQNGKPAPNTIPWDTKAAGLYMIAFQNTRQRPSLQTR